MVEELANEELILVDLGFVFLELSHLELSTVYNLLFLGSDLPLTLTWLTI